MNIMEVMQEKNLGKIYMADGMEFILIKTLSSLWLENKKTQEVIEDNFTLDEILNMDFKECIDWTKVPVDTKILVSNYNDASVWIRRYFAKYENGIIYAFSDGLSSFTVGDTYGDSVCDWKYAKLYEE